MRGLDQLRLLWTLSLRSLYSHWFKSLIVGSIMAFGTFLVVLGTAFIDTIERAMAQSITASLAGHLQIYSAKAKDELALYGGQFMGSEDIGRIDDFSKLQAALQEVPGIKAVVPMGIDLATISSPGELERALGSLRTAIRQEQPSLIPGLKSQIREILTQMKAEQERSESITADKEKLKETIALLGGVITDEFWNAFDADPLAKLEFLDTKVAPLAEEGKLIYFRYLGTDLPHFQENFDRFQIVSGEVVPPNQRGFMFNNKFYEEWVKNVCAKNIDTLAKSIFDKGETIEGSATLQALVRQTARQYRRITYHLDAPESATLEAELKKMLPEVQGGLPELLQGFLTFNDQNFKERHAFFYERIAPMIDLYDVHIGDTISITAFTRSGFLKAVNVKLYGTFTFKGLDKSDLAGDHSLMDILTFRELYGLMSEDKKQELAAIKGEVGVKDVAADSAEEALFGEASDVAPVEVKRAASFDEFAGLDLTEERERMKALQAAGFKQEDIDHGLALNAAVVLEQPEQLWTEKATIEAALKKAGLDLKVVDWQSAAGLVGQFILVIKGVLYIAIFIIFLVALVIINNSMIMATMERVTEIGTMRAIGAQRTMVLAMFLVETAVLGFLAGTGGAAFASVVVKLLATNGVPAPSPELVFLFGGPRLFPELGASNLLLGAVIIVFVSLASTFYPAFLAAQIQPVVAMGQKE